MPAKVVVDRWHRLDGRLVGQIGGHRVNRIDGQDRGLGCFEGLLALFEISEALGHRCILFTKLLGLSLDIRELIGVACRRESQNGRC